MCSFVSRMSAVLRETLTRLAGAARRLSDECRPSGGESDGLLPWCSALNHLCARACRETRTEWSLPRPLSYRTHAR